MSVTFEMSAGSGRSLLLQGGNVPGSKPGIIYKCSQYDNFQSSIASLVAKCPKGPTPVNLCLVGKARGGCSTKATDQFPGADCAEQCTAYWFASSVMTWWLFLRSWNWTYAEDIEQLGLQSWIFVLENISLHPLTFERASDVLRRRLLTHTVFCCSIIWKSVTVDCELCAIWLSLAAEGSWVKFCCCDDTSLARVGWAGILHMHSQLFCHTYAQSFLIWAHNAYHRFAHVSHDAMQNGGLHFKTLTCSTLRFYDCHVTDLHPCWNGH